MSGDLTPRRWPTPLPGGRTPALTVLWHPIPALVGGCAVLDRLALGEKVKVSRRRPRFYPAGGGRATRLDDPFLSREPFTLSFGASSRIVIERSQTASALKVEGTRIVHGCELTLDEVQGGVVMELARRVVLLLHLIDDEVLDGGEATPREGRREDFGVLLLFFLQQELAAVGAEHRLETPAHGDIPWLAAPVVAAAARQNPNVDVVLLRRLVDHIVRVSRNRPHVLWDDGLSALIGAAPEAEARPRGADEITDAEVLEAMRASDWLVRPAAAELGVSSETMEELIDLHPKIRTAAELTVREIEACLEVCHGRTGKAAGLLEVSEHDLRLQMRALGID